MTTPRSEAPVYEFLAVPAWALSQEAAPAPAAVGPPAPASAAVFEAALARVELRSRTLLEQLALAAAGPGLAVLACPPVDLPALLRTADQLLAFARQDEGQKALVFSCECGTRFVAPLTLLRPVDIPCATCARTVSLDPRVAVGTDHLTAPFKADANLYRRQLAAFFREAMANGQAVVVRPAPVRPAPKGA